MTCIGCGGHFTVEARHIGQPRKYCSNECRVKSYAPLRPKRPSRATVHTATGINPEQRRCRIACGLPT